MFVITGVLIRTNSKGETIVTLDKQLRRKLSLLHEQPRPKADDWHQAYVRDITGPEAVGHRRTL